MWLLQFYFSSCVFIKLTNTMPESYFQKFWFNWSGETLGHQIVLQTSQLFLICFFKKIFIYLFIFKVSTPHFIAFLFNSPKQGKGQESGRWEVSPSEPSCRGLEGVFNWLAGVRDPLPCSSPIPVGLNGGKIFLRGFPGFSPSIRASSQTPQRKSLLFSELNTGEGSLWGASSGISQGSRQERVSLFLSNSGASWLPRP